MVEPAPCRGTVRIERNDLPFDYDISVQIHKKFTAARPTPEMSMTIKFGPSAQVDFGQRDIRQRRRVVT